MLQIYLPPAISLPVAASTQTDNTASGQKKIETEMEVEHVFGKGHQPFTIVAATISREFKRFGADSVQLALDGFAGGEFPYVQFRLDACRDKTRESLTANVCAGLGAYHDLSEGGVSPVVGVSGTVDFWRGRVSNYVSFERAFTAPTFTYYHGESVLLLVNAKRWQVTAGVLSRTIQPVGAKVTLQVKRWQMYGTTGKGAHSFGLVLNF
jgi:hypothetical protein